MKLSIFEDLTAFQLRKTTQDFFNQS